LLVESVASAFESIVFVIESAVSALESVVSAVGKHCIFYTLYINKGEKNL